MTYEWRYDNLTKTGYLKLQNTDIKSTTELVDGRVYMDTDALGQVVGVEIIL